MNPHSIRVLEFDQIIDKLHDLCWSVPAKRFVIKPSGSFDQIEYSLDCLSEMIEIYQAENGPPNLIFSDIDLMLEKSAAEGVVLEPSELVKVSRFYDVVMGFTALNDKYENLKIQ